MRPCDAPGADTAGKSHFEGNCGGWLGRGGEGRYCDRCFSLGVRHRSESIVGSMIRDLRCEASSLLSFLCFVIYSAVKLPIMDQFWCNFNRSRCLACLGWRVITFPLRSTAWATRFALLGAPGAVVTFVLAPITTSQLPQTVQASETFLSMLSTISVHTE